MKNDAIQALASFAERPEIQIEDDTYWWRDGFDVSGDHEAQRLDLIAKSLQFTDASGKCRVLDIGCGAGRLPRAVKRLHGDKSRYAYTGIDVMAHEIVTCRETFEGDHAYVFRHLNMRNDMYNGKGRRIRRLPFAAETFDIVYCYSVFSHLLEKDIAFYLREMHRIVRKSGVVFFTAHTRTEARQNPELNPDWYRFEGGAPIPEASSQLMVVAYQPGYLESLVKAHGFEIIHTTSPGYVFASNLQTGYYLRKIGAAKSGFGRFLNKLGLGA